MQQLNWCGKPGLVCAVLACVAALDAAETDWPSWRGPASNGAAAAGQQPPTHWNAEQNVVWTANIPGRGHGSPIVVGNQVLLATANEAGQSQSVLCFDRHTGAMQWEAVVHQGKLPSGLNAKASHASGTLACDGERLFVNFAHNRSAFTTALNRKGQQLWQTRLCGYIVHQGYASSPAVFGERLLVTADNKGGGIVAALNRETGAFIWKQERPQTPNYVSPIVLSANGREQLVLTGCERVTSIDPHNGETLWETDGATTECVTSAVTDGERIFTSGGYPKNHVSAVLADGSKRLVWENNVRVYVPSMIVRNGYLYAVADGGIAWCWDSATGKVQWKERLGGTFSASLVLAGEHLIASNEGGRSFVFAARPDRFHGVAENQLGDEVFATPAVAGNQLFMRVAHRTGEDRHEKLYCIGHP